MNGVAVSVLCTRRRQELSSCSSRPEAISVTALAVEPHLNFTAFSSSVSATAAALIDNALPDMAAKIVLKIEMKGDKDKKAAFMAVSSLQGIDSVSVDMEGQRMTVVGLVDPVALVAKLRKAGAASILSVGPAKKEKDGPVLAYPGGTWHAHPCPPQYAVCISAEEDPNYCAIC